jgi:hypothetical protein
VTIAKESKLKSCCAGGLDRMGKNRNSGSNK